MTGIRQSRRKVLVVGLGVAGSSLLSFLKELNLDLDITCIEVRDQPWTHVVCGEMIPDPTFLKEYVPREIHDLVQQAHELIVKCTTIRKTIKRLNIVLMGKSILEVQFRAYMIDKAKFIRNLLDNVHDVAKCVHVTRVVEWSITGRTVKLRLSNNVVLTADYAVAADGFPSCLYSREHWSFLKTRSYLYLTCTSFRGEVEDHPEDAVSIIVDPGIAAGGYAWIFPRGDGEFNCGFGFTPRPNVDVKKLVDKFCTRYNIRKKGLVLSKTLPLDGLVKPLVYESRLFYIGDAGGFVVPTNGAGINMAIASSKLLAQAKFSSSNFLKLVEPVDKYFTTLSSFRKVLDPVLADSTRLQNIVRRLSKLRLLEPVCILLVRLLLGSYRIVDRLAYKLVSLVLKH